MSANLPENMGKKIVEALKRQALYEEDNSNNVNEIFGTLNTTQNDNEIIEEQNYNTTMQDDIPQLQNQFQSSINTNMQDSVKFSIPNTQQSVNYNNYTTEMPTNVAVLRKLISQLPAGVSKQVGAQIIRQTIEALGISMNSVLQEAQHVQEGLNTSVRDCTIKIQEYKNQIMQLEANAKDYQMQMSQLNDLISLFIMTDNKRI